jgi:hypothetical protein
MAIKGPEMAKTPADIRIKLKGRGGATYSVEFAHITFHATLP